MAVVGDVANLEFEAFLVDEVTIHFADPNLEFAVRDWLKYDLDDPDAPITIEHVPLLTMLTTGDVSISDLSGLEHFVYLDTLYIGHEDNFALDDLSPLENLDNLRMVIVRNGSVFDGCFRLAGYPRDTCRPSQHTGLLRLVGLLRHFRTRGMPLPFGIKRKPDEGGGST